MIPGGWDYSQFKVGVDTRNLLLVIGYMGAPAFTYIMLGFALNEILKKKELTLEQKWRYIGLFFIVFSLTCHMLGWLVMQFIVAGHGFNIGTYGLGFLALLFLSIIYAIRWSIRKSCGPCFYRYEEV